MIFPRIVVTRLHGSQAPHLDDRVDHLAAIVDLLGKPQAFDQHHFGADHLAQGPQRLAQPAQCFAERRRIGAPLGHGDRVFEYLPCATIVALVRKRVAALDELCRDLRRAAPGSIDRFAACRDDGGGRRRGLRACRRSADQHQHSKREDSHLGNCEAEVQFKTAPDSEVISPASHPQTK